MRKIFFLVGVPLAALLAYLPFTVIYDATSPDVCEVVEGVVAQVSSPCCEDLEIRLADDGHRYHVNRGLERGLELSRLESAVGRPVKLWITPTNWTPFDPFGEREPVAQIVVEDDVLWTVF